MKTKLVRLCACAFTFANQVGALFLSVCVLSVATQASAVNSHAGVENSKSNESPVASECTELLAPPDLAVDAYLLPASEVLDNADATIANTKVNHQLSSAMQFLRERVQAGELTLADLEILTRGENPLAARPDFASQQYAQVLQVALVKLGQGETSKMWRTHLELLIKEAQSGQMVRLAAKHETSVADRIINFIVLTREQFDHQDIHVPLRRHDYEIMDAPVTQMQYLMLVALIERYTGKPTGLSWTPSKDLPEDSDGVDFKYENKEVRISLDGAVNGVGYEDIFHTLLPVLNELSGSSEAEIQKALRELFPGHEQGMIYSMPTRKLHEVVMNNLMTEEGHQIEIVTEEEYLIRVHNLRQPGSSPRPYITKSHRVGPLRPLMLFGQSPYLLSRYSELIDDNSKSTISLGSVKASGVLSKYDWISVATANRHNKLGTTPDNPVSFRLVRSKITPPGQGQ